LVDLLSGVLAGAAFGTDVGHPSENRNANVGHFFAAIKIETFRPLETFKADMDTYIRTLKDAPKLPEQNRIYIHGEKEYELTEKYQRNGVPLLMEIVNALELAGTNAGVPFDLKPLDKLRP
jgi:L-2-hydroxycarboxylate dehydrogenase (NAD+)